MKEYFILQYKMANRRLWEAKINPVIGYGLGAMGFVLLSDYLFEQSTFAKYLVVLVALSLLFNLTHTNRNEFLQCTFGTKKFRQIRVIENIIVSTPFVGLLLYHNAFIEASLLFIASFLIATISIKINRSFTIPTPFYKNPFEFTVGFRKTFYIFPIAYALTFIAIRVNNMNLGIFAMLLVFLVAMSFYAKPENEFYVWIHADNPSDFLFKKLKIASIYTLPLALPIVCSLIVYYPADTDLIILFLFAGLFFLWAVILAKYAAYPIEMNIPEAILLVICLYFPPLLLLLIPYLFKKSINKLNRYLR